MGSITEVFILWLAFFYKKRSEKNFFPSDPRFPPGMLFPMLPLWYNSKGYLPHVVCLFGA